jgi:hypothetical protein
VIPAHEFPMVLSLRLEYLDAIRAVDAYLSAARQFHQRTDRHRAATIEACRLAAMQSLRELADLIASVEERKAS